jgi:class 3 adenylate cyclase
VLAYDFSWELEASPEQLWPHVSNTERLNRAVGLSAVEFTSRVDAKRDVRRHGRFRAVGMNVSWEEHPFEWIEGRRLGVLREYSAGPFVWLVSVVELAPRSGTGTTLTHRVRVEPRGLLGRTAAAVEIGVKARRNLDRVYRRIDGAVTRSMRAAAGGWVDPFEESPGLSGTRRKRLERLLDGLGAQGINATVIERLGEFLAQAAPQDVARIRPLALARRLGLAAEPVVAACLHGAREGLLILLWDILCPVCRVPSEVKESLRALEGRGRCEACNLDYELDFANSVELIFRAHPEIRQAELGVFCIGGPAHSPHVAAQARIGPGERIELDLALGEGAYRLRGAQLPYSIDFRVQPGAGARRWELDLTRGPEPELPRVLETGVQTLVLDNHEAHELVVRAERKAPREDALTAARASSLALFRELFPTEVLAPGRLISIATVTLLATDLEGSSRIYQELGDARAFGLVHEYFRLLEQCIRRQEGAMVKTIGEGALASFSESAAAVRAALALQPALTENDATQALRVRVGIHRGPALAATLNDHLDYFGTTVKVVAQLPALVQGGELLLTQTVASDPPVAALLRQRGLTGVPLDAPELIQTDGIAPCVLVRQTNQESRKAGKEVGGVVSGAIPISG